MDVSTIQLLDIPLRFGVHLAAILATVFFLYLRGNGSKDFCFSYIAIGVIVFALCFLLERVKLELGFALGLFAIFGIIRYRTITIPIKEMTYLFVIIGISVINALAGGYLSVGGLLAANAVILLCLALLEVFMKRSPERFMTVRYEKIENLRPEKRETLMADLTARLGVVVTSYTLEEVDFLRDTANLRVQFNLNNGFREVEHVADRAHRFAFDQ